MTIRRVTPTEALTMLQDEGYVYIDVRSVPEFDGGHPEGAYNVPFMKASPMGMKPNLAFLEEVAHHFERDHKLIVGCKSGGRSARACAALAQVGFTDLVDVAGGFDTWRGNGLPHSTSPDGRGYADLTKG